MPKKNHERLYNIRKNLTEGTLHLHLAMTKYIFVENHKYGKYKHSGDELYNNVEHRIKLCSYYDYKASKKR